MDPDPMTGVLTRRGKGQVQTQENYVKTEQRLEGRLGPPGAGGGRKVLPSSFQRERSPALP